MCSQSWDLRTFSVHKVEALRHLGALPTVPAMSVGDACRHLADFLIPWLNIVRCGPCLLCHPLAGRRQLLDIHHWELGLYSHAALRNVMLSTQQSNQEVESTPFCPSRALQRDDVTLHGPIRQVLPVFVVSKARLLTKKGTHGWEWRLYAFVLDCRLISFQTTVAKMLACTSQCVKWKQSWDFHRFGIHKVEVLRHLETLPSAVGDVCRQLAEFLIHLNLDWAFIVHYGPFFLCHLGRGMGGLWEGYGRGVGRVPLRLPTRPANCWVIKFPTDKNPLHLPDEGTQNVGTWKFSIVFGRLVLCCCICSLASLCSSYRFPYAYPMVVLMDYRFRSGIGGSYSGGSLW